MLIKANIRNELEDFKYDKVQNKKISKYEE